MTTSPGAAGRRAPPRRRAPAQPKDCERCFRRVRPLQEIAAELRDFTPEWRAWRVFCETEYDARYPSRRSPDQVAADAQDSDRLVASAADNDLPGLAIELEGKLCRECARAAGERFAQTRKRAFVGLLASFRSTGRDERAEEEFQLRAVAA